MIGVFGGTFDPVHFGHLRAACEVLERLELSEVRLIPCGDPAHRQPAMAGAHERLAMVSLAVADSPGLLVDDREIRRPGPSYMVDTLDSLRAELPQDPLCLILGLDAFLGLEGWHRWERILDLAHIAVMRRPGVTIPAGGPIRRLLEEREVEDVSGLAGAGSGRILFVPITQLDISATQIRVLLAAGHRADFLTPPAVLAHIGRQGLYGILAKVTPEDPHAG